MLQLNEETDRTLIVPSSFDEVRAQIMEAKSSAIKDAKTCSMHLDSYNDKELMMENINEIVLVETENDNIDVFESENLGVDNATNIDVDSAIQEDLVQMRLKRNNNKGMPTYEATIDKGSKTHKSYKSSQFIKYQGAFIRKSTALYLLQENQVLSSNRLIRVREEKNIRNSHSSSRNCFIWRYMYFPMN